MTTRTHLLSQLAINGRELVLDREPTFDFYRAQKVLKLGVDFDGLPSLRLDLAYEGPTRRSAVGLLFEGVCELLLPSMSPQLFLPELEFEDLRDRMLEGIGFEAISRFEGAFRCTCASISILSFSGHHTHELTTPANR